MVERGGGAGDGEAEGAGEEEGIVRRRLSMHHGAGMDERGGEKQSIRK